VELDAIQFLPFCYFTEKYISNIIRRVEKQFFIRKHIKYDSKNVSEIRFVGVISSCSSPIGLSSTNRGEFDLHDHWIHEIEVNFM
jgi:hypothetical protein